MRKRILIFGCLVAAVAFSAILTLSKKNDPEEINQRCGIKLPPGFVLTQSWSRWWEKDPAWYWRFHHSNSNLNILLNQGFKKSEGDEADYMKMSILEEVQEDVGLTNSTFIYHLYRAGRGETYLLVSADKSNSWLAYLGGR
jgi:hypothetical protein